jgi:hypothetical protein
MASCPKISKSKSRVCVGDLGSRIELLRRSITAPTNNVDYSEDFESLGFVYASVDTGAGVNSGYRDFDGVGQNEQATHAFYIRYNPTLELSSQDWINYKGDYYTMLSIDNMNEEDRFLKIRAIKKGGNTVQSNWVG